VAGEGDEPTAVPANDQSLTPSEGDHLGLEDDENLVDEDGDKSDTENDEV